MNLINKIWVKNIEYKWKKWQHNYEKYGTLKRKKISKKQAMNEIWKRKRKDKKKKWKMKSQKWKVKIKKSEKCKV